MEIVFIRHAQGEHTVRPPASLQIPDPALTETGIGQAAKLKETFPLTSADAVIASPTRRTLQTASIWSEDVPCVKIVHPLVGPRMFPLLPPEFALPCDRSLSGETIRREFPHFEHAAHLAEHVWQYGINALPDHSFHALANEFVRWCQSLNKPRLYVVTHDGTIASYRRHISGEALTRADFQGETGWHIMSI